MERQLPTVMINDTEFIVDLKNNEFRQLDNPSNKISFNEVHDLVDRLVIIYDKTNKNVYRGNWAEQFERNDIEHVEIPPLVKLDQVAFSELLNPIELYHLAEEINKGHLRSEVNQQPRVLPTVDIEGTVFIVDARLAELRQHSNPFNRISFQELFPVADNKVGFFFDPKSKTAFSGTREQWHNRTDIRLVELPSIKEINASKVGTQFKTSAINAQVKYLKDISGPGKEEAQRQLLTHQRRRKGRGI